MLGRILLDNDYFLVTAGLLGAIKVTLKSRGLTLKATREERTKLLDVLDELKRRGYSVEPDSKEFEEILGGFSEALLGRGGYRWQAYFLVTTCENIVNGVVGESDNSNFDWNDISSFFDWEGRPAVTVIPSDGLLEGWFIHTSSEPGVWERASPLEIRDSGRMLSEESFQEVFQDRLEIQMYRIEDYPKPKEEDYKTTEEFEEAHAWWMKQVSQFMRKVPGVIQTEQTTEDFNNSENPKDSQDDWMDKATKALEVTPEEWQKVIEEHTFEELEKEDQARNLKPEVDNYKLANIAYENWKEEAKEQVKKIKEFVVDGRVKFEDVEELGYEIKDFISTSEEWCEGDLIYDFTTEAQQLLNNLNISSVGKNKD